jgi:transcriptional regulator with XRE-family HTH domain
MTDYNKDFGARLRELVKNEGVKQVELAIYLNVSPPAVTNYLYGRVPDADILMQIAEYFGVTVDFLLTGESPWQDGVYVGGRKVAETGSDLDLYRELGEADEATRARVKAILEADRKMLEEKKLREQAGDTGQVDAGPRRRGGKKRQ